MPVNQTNKSNTLLRKSDIESVLEQLEAGPSEYSSEILIPHDTLLKGLNITEDELDETEDIYDSFPTRAADKINIPEVKKITSNFVYNYFTKDERRRNSSDNESQNLIILDSSDSRDELYRIAGKKLPRYVEINLVAPNVDRSIITIENINTDSDFIDKNLGKILFEGATSNSIFVGLELLDTNKEDNIYTMLNASSTFLDINNDINSKKETAQILYETLEEKGGLEGLDKKLIVEALSDIKSSGYNYSDSDVRRTIAEKSKDPLGKQTFSMQFNKLLMKDIVNNANIVSDNIFNDEMRALEEFANEQSFSVLNSINDANLFSEADYEMSIDAIETQNINSYFNESKYPDIKLVGYILEKFEVMQDENVKLITRRFVKNFNTRKVIDKNVRYGGNYFYKLRTLCKVEMIAQDDSDQNVLAKFLMASEGKITNILCVEEVPPPPPQSLKVSFDFETLLPYIRWELPHNKQRDIKRFQVFKRFNTSESFTLIAEIDFDNSYDPVKLTTEVAQKDAYYKVERIQKSFLDKTHKEGEKPIYSVCCVDAHGLSSNYGAQVQVERDRYTNKVNRKIISGPNAPKPYPNLLLNVDAFKDNIKISGYDRAVVVFDPEYYDVYKTGDTGEEVSLKLLAIDSEKARYKFHFINIDNQKDKIINVKLQNKASIATKGQDAFETSTAKFNSNNVSFQY